MSHFAVYVFHEKGNKSVDDLLAPYDENLEMAPYVQYTKEQAIEKCRKDIEDYKNGIYAEYLADPVEYEKNHSRAEHLDYLKNIFPKKLTQSDEECYAEVAQYYDEDMIDEKGNLYSTYNPNSKWDWFVVGGRWNNGIIKKNGKCVNQASVSDVDWEKTRLPFAFMTPNGVWHEHGNMGWWGIVYNEKEKDQWQKEFEDVVANFDGDVCVTLVDCHI